MAKDASPKNENRLHAIVSAGNTGAMVSAAQMHMRRIPNVVRPGIAVTVPTFAGVVVLIDVGANIEPKPVHLAQYGVMGAIYAKIACNITNPRVAIMNVGGEEAKGTDDIRLARDMLRSAAGLNFTGLNLLKDFPKASSKRLRVKCWRLIQNLRRVLNQW